MTDQPTQAAPNGMREFPVTLALAAVMLFFVASGFIAYWNTRILYQDARLVSRTHETITTLDGLLSLVKDAETGQRGFVLTGNESYLAPYRTALDAMPRQLAKAEEIMTGNAAQKAQLPELRSHISAKLKELEETVELRRSRGFEAARAVILTDRGKSEMDRIRLSIGGMQEEERLTRNRRLAEMEEAYRNAIASGLVSAILGVVLSGLLAQLMRRAATARRREEWLQQGEVGLAQTMLGEQGTEQLGNSILTYLARYCGAQAGAFYTREGECYHRRASYGVPEGATLPERFAEGQGLLGQAAKEKRGFLISEVPTGYLAFGSALAKGDPAHLLVAPVQADGRVHAVLELGSLQPMDEAALTLIAQAESAIGTAVKAADYRVYLQNLLEETQRQAEELQAQSEELRVNNEELEEQTRALKESQSCLEQQQVELEQTNAQLEEQAQTLEAQRDDLGRAKESVQLKARELEQASQYKSDFLANMSHELRTPLNSSLILAKLLADNPQGNLSEEQVQFAETIRASGNDLLALINDILDLSKIEAGHMEMRPEEFSLSRLGKDMARIFEPLAAQKGLQFRVVLAEDCPEAAETDRQRLEQVLKNLIANAVKFTESGHVELAIQCAPGGQLAFQVSDTGIGIPPEQQRAIFDAFRQADGAISRRYGGTGLGLSISRELARLLGGRITLASQPGEGSRFTLHIPAQYAEAQAGTAPHAPTAQDAEPPQIPPPSAETAPSTPPSQRVRRMRDDREMLNGARRVILVVEDDETFAAILYDMVHQLDFQCLLAASAEDALLLARQYLPSAVVLDVGLPDHSGLSVLDRMKRDPRTRHIPVHVVSGGDHAQTALSLGAIGYMLKPAKREELVETLRRLETHLEQRMRRVLIVEDDAVQRDSMRRLLGSQEVETEAVGTAAECLERLKEATYDCMVLDLSLPDASGYSLLETLSREDAYSFPPTVVYTGRDLSAEEEQKLRRYSKSIIIKGAKSPERLLDEVTLFLHQVVAELPPEQQKMIERARNRDAVLENRRILVVEDDVRNVYAVTSIFEPLGAKVQIARNGREALEHLAASRQSADKAVDLVLMDVMMPEMDGLTATREIRKSPEWKKLPIIMLTAKAMKDDQERCLEAGANDYMAKPLDVEKLLSLVRVWMPR